MLQSILDMLEYLQFLLQSYFSLSLSTVIRFVVLFIYHLQYLRVCEYENTSRIYVSAIFATSTILT